MMIQVILTKTELDRIGELRGTHIAIGSMLVLTRKRKMDKQAALEKIEEQILKAEEIWRDLTKEGI